MATIRNYTRYEQIQLHRARQRDFAELAEQRSQARREAAERVMAKGETLRSAVSNVVANTNQGMSQLMANIIRTRVAAEAAAKAKAASKQA